MLFLTDGVESAQPDYIALAIVAALFILVAVMALRKRFAKPAVEEAAPVLAAPVPASELPVAPGCAGQLKLHDVPPKTAAMLMAIVADKTGKPLNELRFISIKEVRE